MFNFLRILRSDPVGIQTQDLQNRNLTLYSAKLRDRCANASAKVRQFIKNQELEYKNYDLLRVACSVQNVSQNQAIVIFLQKFLGFCLQYDINYVSLRPN